MLIFPHCRTACDRLAYFAACPRVEIASAVLGPYQGPLLKV